MQNNPSALEEAVSRVRARCGDENGEVLRMFKIGDLRLILDALTEQRAVH